MQIVWDEPKRLTNLEERQLDFADVTIDFFVDAVVVPAKKGRYKAVGMFRGVPHTVIFKRLGTEGISIVSFRRADRKERSL